MSTTVLIIDSDKLLTRQLEAALIEDGYRVISAFSGNHGLELTKTTNAVVTYLLE